MAIDPPPKSDGTPDPFARFIAGREIRAWKELGARPATEGGVEGVRFSVWAPNAISARVVGTFNDWDGRVHPLRRESSSGVWCGFVPGLRSGALYKYEFSTQWGGKKIVRADPFARAAEEPPNTASVVPEAEEARWSDADWMANRAHRHQLDQPMSIYEVHLGSWKRAALDDDEEDTRPLTYLELADQLVPYARDLGFTHLELLPVTEHPYDGSWGYQTTGYFAPTSRFGAPADFREFVDRAHRAGLGIILDWVPGHFPRDAHGLGFFDGADLFEHADPRRGSHPDWGTYIFDFAKPPVVSFLISSALYWLEEFHIDGLRVDAVASMLYLDYSREAGEWVPNPKGGRENLDAVSFLRRLNSVIRREHPDVLVCAEESTSWPGVTKDVESGGLGFHYKWNMGWMNDTLSYFRQDPILRKKHHEKLSFSLTYAFSETFLLPFSHDEVVHGKASLLAKMPGDHEGHFANLRALFAYQFVHPGKKLLFMGGEFGQWSEWSHERALEWSLLQYPEHQRLHDLVGALNRIYRARTALHALEESWEGFEWLEVADRERSVITFLRRGPDPADFLVVAANFTPVVWKDYRMGVPTAFAYRPVFNSDASRFGGKGARLAPRVYPEDQPHAGREVSLVVDLPPLAVVIWEPCAAPFGRNQPA